MTIKRLEKALKKYNDYLDYYTSAKQWEDNTIRKQKTYEKWYKVYKEEKELCEKLLHIAKEMKGK